MEACKTDDSKLIWKASCHNVFNTPSRTIVTRDPVHVAGEKEEPEDKTFYASETKLMAPRTLDYKFDPDENENYEMGRSLTMDEDQFVAENHMLNSREYRIDSGYDDSNHSDPVSEDSHDHSFRTDSPEYDDRMIRAEQRLVKRSSYQHAADNGRVNELPLSRQSNVDDDSMTQNSETERAVTEKSKDPNAKLQAMTAMARKLSRPIMRRDEDPPSFDEESCDILKWTHLNSSGNSKVDDTCEFDKFSQITAETRKAAKPKVHDLDLSQVKHKTRSVAHVTSPTVPALFPNRQACQFSRSLSSNSNSSSSDITTPSPSYVPDPCFRCGKQVYPLDKIGPIRRVLFHKQCFRCVECSSVLNLKNYCQNSNDKTDKQIYCKNHQPQQEKGHVGLEDRNINILLNNPKLDKVNTNIRGPEDDKLKSLNNRPVYVRGASIPKLDIVCGNQYGFSYTNGLPIEHDAGSLNPKLNKITSPREMSIEEVNPRRVWTRSAISAASLDLSAPMSGRNAHHFYHYGSGAFNHL